MSEVVPEVAAAVEALALPRPEEWLRVRQAVVGRLASGPAALEELTRLAYVDADLPPDPGDEQIVLSARDAVHEVNADQPGLRRLRVHRALREVLNELAVLGIITRLNEAPNAQPERHGISWPGRGDSVAVPWPAPDSPAPAYRLSELHQDEVAADLEPLDPVLYLNGLEPLLGPRGVRCANEALTAWRRRLYLASLNMLGAASEAAWYRLGELLRDGDDQLGRAVDEDRTARVIELAGQRLRERRVPAADIAELTTHASYLRQLRNYGAHPRAERDPDLEATFTEGMSAVLLASTRRYFVRLARSAERSGIDLG